MKKVTKTINNKRSKKSAPICVLLTSYNYELFVIEALESVKDQVFESLDIVVIDDCSRDNSITKITKWFKQNGDRFNSFTILQNISNQGVVMSRNIALQYIQSDLVFMLDSDNVLYPQCIAKLSKALVLSGKEFAYPILERFGNETRLINLTPWNPKLFHYGNAIDNMALFKKSAIQSVDGYSPDMKGSGWEDFELFIKFAQKGFSGCHVPEILARYRVHGMSSVTDKAASIHEARWKYLREKHQSFFDEIIKEEIMNNPPLPIIHHKQPFVLRVKWALRNPLKFSKKYIWKKTPQYSQVMWALHNPMLFCKKYFIPHHKYLFSREDAVLSVENSSEYDRVLKTVYFISNVEEGGSKKYILDLMNSFETINLKFVQIKNKSDVENYKKDFRKGDILLFQYLLFTDFVFQDIIDIKRNYQLKLVIPTHDFYFFGQSLNDFYQFNMGVHSNYSTITKLRPEVTDLLQAADVIIYPSQFVKNAFDAVAVFKYAVLCPHIDYVLQEFLQIPPVEQVIKIGIINTITPNKGLREYPKLFRMEKYKGYRIEYHIFGTQKMEGSNVIFQGPYKEDEIFSLLKKHSIHGLAFLNEYGETYSYALTKGINTGLPLLYSNLGAYVERLRNNPRFFPVHNAQNIEVDMQKMLHMILKNQGSVPVGIVNQPKIYVPDFYRKLFEIDYLTIFNRQYKKHKASYQKVFNFVEPYAIYFPQFHELKENNRTFYEGYHDMINLESVKKVDSRIETPLKNYLGYYNLATETDIVDKQIEIARTHGLKGFGIYYYWFSHNSVTGNSMLMKDIIDKFFQREITDFDVFFIYANESWSNNPAFNQNSNEYIIKNEYTETQIRKNFENLLPYFKHVNYKKVDDKPVLFLHHPWEMTLDEFKSFHSIGTEMMKQNGFSGLELITNSMHGRYDGYKHYSHHPNYKNTQSFTSVEHGVKYIDYQKYVDTYLPGGANRSSDVQTVFYNFDNSVRYFNHKNKNVLITKTKNNTLQYLKKFLNLQLETYVSREKTSKILLINSWNEWGEQMAIEPSAESGFKILEVFQKALLSRAENNIQSRKKILYVGHDAGYYGAQLLSLYIIRELKERFKFDVVLVLKSGGPLEKEYAKHATVYNFSDPEYSQTKKYELIENLFQSGVEYAIVNTVICGDILGILHEKGVKTISLIHELPGTIKQYNAEENAKIIAEKADHIVFPSAFVQTKFNEIIQVPNDKISVHPQGLIRENEYRNRKKEARTVLRKNLGLPQDAHIVLAVGSGNLRKGIDLFFDVANRIQNKRIYFVWVGDMAPEVQEMTSLRLSESDNVRVIPSTTEIALYYAGSDVYLLPSREDPFPIVVMESMAVGVPVVAFNNAGGFVDIVTSKTGVLVPFEDTPAMATAVENLLKNNVKLKKLGDESQKLIEHNFIFKDYVYDLLAAVGIIYKKVSVVVPNYNYAKYLLGRLNSILTQTYPVYEVLILDDASSDQSARIIDTYISEHVFLGIQKIINSKNSGSVFRQWVLGIQKSRGEYLWIAEADDLASPSFLEYVMKGFDDQRVILSYSQSKIIDERGRKIADNYFEYTDDIDDMKWKKEYIRLGIDEITDSMAIRNTIPNISAVVFKKIPLDTAVIKKIQELSIAGDWFFYVWLLHHGYIAYTPEALNIYRRHPEGVTHNIQKEKHFNEIVALQEHIASLGTLSGKTTEKVILYRNKIKDKFKLP